MKSLGWQAVAGLVGLGMLALAGAAGTATATRAETGKLTFHGELAWHGRTVDCPTGTPPSVTCRMHEGAGVIPGLGTVSEQYIFFNEGGTPECPGTYRVRILRPASPWAREGRSKSIRPRAPIACRARAKGHAQLHLHDYRRVGNLCRSLRNWLVAQVVDSRLRQATETSGTALSWCWGLLLTPLLLFFMEQSQKDPRSASWREAGTRRFRVSALDETDGAITVSCRPATGSRFKVGRTIVTCSATDRSGNSGRARFTVTVRARR